MTGFFCEECGTGLIDQCYRCGAPQCCSKCCEGDMQALMEIIRVTEAIGPDKMAKALDPKFVESLAALRVPMA